MDTGKIERKSTTIIFTIILSLLAIVPLMAQEVKKQESAPVAKENAVQDYTKGFHVFYKLGLPDVSKAEYVQLNSKDLSILYSLVQNPFRANGNAWLMKKEEGGSPASFVAFNAIPIKAYEQRKLFEEFTKRKKDSKSDPRKKYSEFLAENKSKIMGHWASVDIKEDIEELLSRLEEMEKENFSYQKELAGPVFLYAVQIYSKGFKDEANKIISRLFELAGDKKIVLLAAMSCLADQQYGKAILELQEDGDWKKFGAALEALLKKYPKGWRAAPGIKLLLAMVQKQIAQPVAPEIKGEGISGEDKKLAAELVNVKEASSYNDAIWLLPKSDKERGRVLQDEVIEKIIGRGKEAIPMLIALLKDDYMLPSCNIRNFNRRRDNGENQDQAEDSLSRIPHPVKRKDIAKALLLPVVTLSGMREDSDIMSMDDNAFAELCNNWYDEIKTKTPDGLVLYYLKNGNRNQKYLALMSMMSGNVEKNAPAVEEFFLNMKKEELVHGFGYGPIPEYVAKRKKAALPFIEKLKAKFKDELAAVESDNKKGKKDQTKKKDSEKETVEVEEAEEDEDDSFMNDPEERKQLKKSLDALSELASGKSAKQIIDKILLEKENLQERTIYSQLMLALQEMDRDEALGLLLYGISKAGDNIIVKGTFITGIATISRIGGAATGNGKEEKPLDIGKNAEAWRKLLSDETTLGEDKVNFIAALFIEYLYGSKDIVQKMNNLKYVLGERSRPIILKRAEERLAGKTEKELTPYPEIKELDEKASKELVANLEKAITGKKVEEFMKETGDSEFAALSKLVAKDPKLNAGLKDYANRIVSVKSKIKGKEKDLDAFKNTVLDMNTVEKIQEYCKKLTVEKKAFNCRIIRKRFLEGVNIEISDPSEYMKGRKTQIKGNIDIPLYMTGIINASSNQAYTQWKISDKNEKGDGNEIVVNGKKIKLEKADEDETKRNKKSQEKFLKCLGKVFGDETDCTKSFSVNYSYMRY